MPNYGSIAATRRRLAPKRFSLRSVVVSLMIMGVATVAMVGVFEAARGGRGVSLMVEPPGFRRAAARGRAKQARMRAASMARHSMVKMADVPSKMAEWGFSTFAAEAGQWMSTKFPGSFAHRNRALSDGQDSADEVGNCDCEEKKCFICLHEEHGGHDGHGHGGHGHDDHGGVESLGNATAHHKDNFDNEMLSIAMSGLHESNPEEEHEEYHPIMFFNYVNKCCPHPKMVVVSSGDSNSDYDQPCYWDADELDPEQWTDYGDAVVCTTTDFKEAHTLVNTLDTWVIALVCALWMTALVLVHNYVHDFLHSHHQDGNAHSHDDGHGHDADDKPLGPRDPVVGEEFLRLASAERKADALDAGV